jgi:competence protein ComEC
MRTAAAWGLAVRFAVLVGATAGVALSPFAPDLPAPWPLVGMALLAILPGAGPSSRTLRLLGIAALALVAGLALGRARVEAIDRGAFTAPAGEAVEVHGFVAAVPRRSHGEVAVRLETASGRLLLRAPEPVPDLPTGGEVRARGTVRQPADWERGYLARYGIHRVVEADRIELTDRVRGGVDYLTDRVRTRAEAALERGTPPAQAAMLRGFVLGQDDRIEPETIEDFQRSGLAHLLAVSGQNVMLLALLALPILALAGVPLRSRLACVLGLIAVYVPVAGAGASIQRAGVMGAAGIIAALASRPTSRWYAMTGAALVTLVLNPRASADVGWQLSFAAVAGIALWSAPLSDRLAGSRRGGPPAPGPAAAARRALADGFALTAAATIATAPLMAHHFERLSIAALPANLLALPAVAPVMWLGMLAAAAGQLPWLPVEPLTGVAGLLAAYISQVGAWLGDPGWAQVEIQLGSPLAVALAYAILLLGSWVVARAWAVRSGLSPPRPRRRVAPAVGALLIVGVALALVRLDGPRPDDPATGLRVTVLDVGQGDAILLEPPDGPAVLVDGGPPGAGLARELERIGVERLGAAVLTHDQADHAGGLVELLERGAIGGVVTAGPSSALARRARMLDVPRHRVARGSELRFGSLGLEVLWPPREPGGAHEADPNLASIVLLARWRRFEMLLTGDAEAEAAPLDPGPIDVLKVAHHGSADAGLDALLERASPRLAVISVGAGNPYGHPTAETLATLAEHRVPTLRTDVAGSLTLAVERDRFGVGTGE